MERKNSPCFKSMHSSCPYAQPNYMQEMYMYPFPLPILPLAFENMCEEHEHHCKHHGHREDEDFIESQNTNTDEDDRITSNVDEILYKIERRNPMILRQLTMYGIPYPQARRLMRQMIHLTLLYSGEANR